MNIVIESLLFHWTINYFPYSSLVSLYELMANSADGVFIVGTDVSPCPPKLFGCWCHHLPPFSDSVEGCLGDPLRTTKQVIPRALHSALLFWQLSCSHTERTSNPHVLCNLPRRHSTLGRKILEQLSVRRHWNRRRRQCRCRTDIPRGGEVWKAEYAKETCWREWYARFFCIQLMYN